VAQAYHLEWSQVGWGTWGSLKAYDIAVCDDGTMYLLFQDSASPATSESYMARTDYSVYYTNWYNLYYQHPAANIAQISCSIDRSNSNFNEMTALWYTGLVTTQYADGGTGPDFTWSSATHYGFQYHDYIGTEGVDLKAFGSDSIVVLDGERYAHVGLESDVSETISWNYLGDMWGARRIAVTASGAQVAFEANEYTGFWVNVPQSGVLSTFDGGWQHLDYVLPWWLDPKEDFGLYQQAIENHARRVIDMEAARSGEQVFLFTLDEDGYVYRGRLVP
jgi:hypothetical protein